MNFHYFDRVKMGFRSLPLVFLAVLLIITSLPSMSNADEDEGNDQLCVWEISRCNENLEVLGDVDVICSSSRTKTDFIKTLVCIRTALKKYWVSSINFDSIQFFHEQRLEKALGKLCEHRSGIVANSQSCMNNTEEDFLRCVKNFSYESFLDHLTTDNVESSRDFLNELLCKTGRRMTECFSPRYLHGCSHEDLSIYRNFLVAALPPVCDLYTTSSVNETKSKRRPVDVLRILISNCVLTLTEEKVKDFKDRAVALLVSGLKPIPVFENFNERFNLLGDIQTTSIDFICGSSSRMQLYLASVKCNAKIIEEFPLISDKFRLSSFIVEEKVKRALDLLCEKRETVVNVTTCLDDSEELGPPRKVWSWSRRFGWISRLNYEKNKANNISVLLECINDASYGIFAEDVVKYGYGDGEVINESFCKTSLSIARCFSAPTVDWCSEEDLSIYRQILIAAMPPVCDQFISTRTSMFYLYNFEIFLRILVPFM